MDSILHMKLANDALRHHERSIRSSGMNEVNRTVQTKGELIFRLF